MNKPLFDRVIVEKITEETTKAGIILTTPESNEYFYKGKVLSFGKDCKYVTVGDIVAIGRNSGTDWQDDNGSKTWFRIIRESDILFITEQACLEHKD